jgi:periplasmic protein CpxP/Spy
MKRYARIGLAVALLAALVGGTTWVSAAEDGPRHGQRGAARRERGGKLGEEGARKRGGHMQALGKKLDLTDEQKAEIREILESHADEIKEAREAVAEKRQALRDLVHTDDVRARAIQRAADALGEAIGDAAVLRAEIRAEIRDVLTKEQQEQADELRTEVKERVGERRGEGGGRGRGARHGRRRQEQ